MDYRGDNTLCLEKRHGIPKKREVFRNCALAPQIAYGVHDNCIGNVLRGVVERVMFVEGPSGLSHPPQATAGVFSELAYFRVAVAKRVGKATPISLPSLAGMYRGRKQTICLEAGRSLYLKGVCRQDARLSTFVKAEKILLEKEEVISDPAPRVIQPRSPRFNAALGVFLKPIEHRIYRAINRVWGETVVMKGLNSQQRGGVFVRVTSRFRKPSYVSSDYSRFDQSVGVEALRFEHGLYLCVFPGYTRKLSKLLNMQLVNEGTARCADGKLNYTVHGGRMSGDMNTSLGNVFLACAVAHGYVQTLGFEVCLLNDGDDCCFVMESENTSKFIAGFAPYVLRFGFRAKVEKPVYNLAEVDFCQCSPIWTPEGTFMVRNPWKALAKDATSVLPLGQPRMAERLYTSIGVGGLSMSRGIPVFQSFYQSLIRAGNGRTFRSLPGILDSGFHYMHQGVEMTNTLVHPRTRYEFWLAFSMLPDLQYALEAHYDELVIPTVLTRGFSFPTESVVPPIVKFKHSFPNI